MSAALEVEALRKRFGDVVALDGLDLVTAEGDVVALLGPNGAGKTTLVRALATLLKPDSGRARVLSHDVVADPSPGSGCPRISPRASSTGCGRSRSRARRCSWGGRSPTWSATQGPRS